MFVKNIKKILLIYIFLNIIIFNQQLFNLFSKSKIDINQKIIGKRLEKTFLERYPNVRKCNSLLSNYQESFDKLNYEFQTPARNETHSIRILRGIIFYFPIEKYTDFIFEFAWMYRSWIEMQKYEPSKWRTDLVIFIQNNYTNLSNYEKFNEMNCSFNNIRQNIEQEPMCTMISYNPLKKRKMDNQYLNIDEKLYDYLLDDMDIFEKKNEQKFSDFLIKSIKNYQYADSILIAFEGYEYFKKAGYNFLIRSDLDIFLTPLFGKWLPRYCNDFYVGGGSYSTFFNSKRLERIAKNLNLKYGYFADLGSTWYSTPDQFRLVSYLTLFGMSYLYSEEFSEQERNGALGVLLWPDWHFGVLLLYGQNLIMNHLIKNKELNITCLHGLLDAMSNTNQNVHKIIHIHTYHDDRMFSKFAFKEGKYDSIGINFSDTNLVKFYCSKMAIEGKLFLGKKLYKLYLNEISNKN